ncbi:MAG: MliC family protein [Halioglobus sp.]|nr:MliC family protein [Halioglobus sp.]
MKKCLRYLLLLLVCSVASAEEPGLTVILGKPIIYLAQNNTKFTARYGALSDNSLSFIKITFPDGVEKTLPRALAASGERYSDERELEWWEHQGSICLSKRDNKTQDWLRCYWKLKEMH